MGKHKHEKHKHHRPSREYDDAPLNPVPKLIVKIGADMTPERVDSPAAPVLYPSDNQFHHHHRHKEKKKKKKKDKKKSHDKDKEHRHRKKRKREYSSLEADPNQLPVKVPRLETELKEEPGVLAPKRESPPPSRISLPDVKQKSTLTKVLEHLLMMLEKKDVSNFFTHPVSDAMAPGYSQIIKEPMDFSTMRQKIGSGAYESLAPFRRDFGLICNNCMLYNTPDTIYHKAAKRLLQLGSRVLLPDRLRALGEHIPIILELTPQQLGFNIKEEVPAEMTVEEEKDISRVLEEIRGGIRRPPGRFEAIPDNLPPQDISNQVKAAAASAAARLSLRKPGSQMGFLRQKQDGTTSLAFVTPVEGSAAGERAVTLGQLIGRVKNGAAALQGFKEDRRNGAKAFNPIYYGAFSSYGPAYDSTFANLTKQETELVYSTYGDDVGVAYAESIKNFSKNCEYATFIVDHLLDILTGNEHKKTSKYVEEQKCLRAEESAVKAAFESEVKVEAAAGGVDFASLKSLADEGIDMSFLDSLQTLYSDIQASPASKLESNAALIETLRDVQHDRLSGPPPTHLGQVSGPSQEECEIAERVQANLVSMVGKSRPKDIFVQNGRS